MKKLGRFGSFAGFLVVAGILLLLSGGDTPVEVAVWMAPAVLLAFVRQTRAWVGLPLAFLLLAATSLIADEGMLPVPGMIAVIITLTGSVYAIIPYTVERLFMPSAPFFTRTLVFPFSAVAVESILLSEGTWGNLAYGVQNLPVLQMASVLGLNGIIFLVYWTAAVANEVWEMRSRWPVARPVAVAWLLGIVVILGFGEWRLRRERPADRPLTVAGVVPGPGHRDTMMEAVIRLASPEGGSEAGRLKAVMDETFQGLLERSERMAEGGADLVLWSEGAVVIPESEERVHLDRVRELAWQHNIFVGLGLIVLKGSGPSSGEPYLENKLVLVSPDGAVAWEYRKANLAPGMERQWTIGGNGALPAAEFAGGIITGAICYDLDFPEHIRQAGAMGADLLLAPSNDWPEIKETHWRMARMRAIEYGVSILRPSSSGVSTAIDPLGRIPSRVDFFESGGAPLYAVLTTGSVSTIYSSLGNSWTWICVLGAVFLILLAGSKMWHARTQETPGPPPPGTRASNAPASGEKPPSQISVQI